MRLVSDGTGQRGGQPACRESLKPHRSPVAAAAAGEALRTPSFPERHQVIAEPAAVPGSRRIAATVTYSWGKGRGRAAAAGSRPAPCGARPALGRGRRRRLGRPSREDDGRRGAARGAGGVGAPSRAEPGRAPVAARGTAPAAARGWGCCRAADAAAAAAPSAPRRGAAAAWGAPAPPGRAGAARCRPSPVLPGPCPQPSRALPAGPGSAPPAAGSAELLRREGTGRRELRIPAPSSRLPSPREALVSRAVLLPSPRHTPLSLRLYPGRLPLVPGIPGFVCSAVPSPPLLLVCSERSWSAGRQM